MKLYSDFRPRRTRQVISDVIAVGWIVFWAWIGLSVYRLTMMLAAFGRQMEDAGAGFRANMTEVGDKLGAIPFIGSGIRVPFEGASGAGGALEAAGRGQQDLVQLLALALAFGISTLPIVIAVAVWLVPRIRFARRAGRAKAVVRAGAGIDLLALRALANQKMTTLAKVDADAMGAWRRGDDAVMRELASLELQSAGIRLRA